MMKRYYLLIFVVFPLISVSQIDINPDDEGILITEKGKEVLYYQTEPRSIEGKYLRSNYFHPLWDLKGNIITEDFPPDHLHHRGIFWAWHQVLANGNSAGNLWELKDIVQDVAEVEYALQPTGAGVLKTEVYWKTTSPSSVSVTNPFIRETARVTIHPRMKNYRQIDFEISLVALTEKVLIGGSADDKGYGGFSVRLKLPSDVSFYGAEGTVTPELTQVESPGWMNIQGLSGKRNETYGIVIADCPENPGYPQKWILRREKSMQNIVFPGSKPVEISRSVPLILKYTVLVHNGKISKAAINRIVKKQKAAI